MRYVLLTAAAFGLSACAHPNEVISRTKTLQVLQADGTVQPQDVICTATVEYQGRSRKQSVTIGFAGATAALSNEGGPVGLQPASATVQAADLAEYQQCIAFLGDPETPAQRATYLHDTLARQQRRNDAASRALASGPIQPPPGATMPSAGAPRPSR